MSDRDSRSVDSWQSEDGRFLRDSVLRAGERLGIAVTEEQLSLLERQLELVLKANEKINLTAIRNPRDAVIKHTIDSMLFYPAYHRCRGRYLDIGTGAGYPGMVLEILEPREGVLLDSVAKKVEACRRIGSELGLAGIRYVAERVETFALEEPESFGVVTARAVAPVEVLLEYAQPLLKEEGVLIVSKGHIDETEEENGLFVASQIGMATVSRETFSLPLDMGERTLMVFEKSTGELEGDGVSLIKLPRRVGRAVKRPLSQQFRKEK